MRVRFHNWWNAPRTLAKVQEIDPVASHGSWMENFPWTRLPGVVQPTPAQADGRPRAHARCSSPARSRDYLGDGNFGGYYQRPDEDMLAIWQVAVEETRELLEGPAGRERRTDPHLGRRRDRRHARRRLIRAGHDVLFVDRDADARRGHERARPRASRARSRRSRVPAAAASLPEQLEGRFETRPPLRQGAAHAEAATGAAAAPRRRRLRGLGPERPQRARHRRDRRRASAPSAASSTSAPTTWSRA